jgi:hypothetical protein
MSGVKALTEDRDSAWGRAMAAYTAGMVTRDEAREEAGLDPIDNFPVWAGGAAAEDEQPEPEQELEPEQRVEANTAAEQTELEDAEEKRFRAYAKKRAKEGKTDDVYKFAFRRLPPARRAAVLEAMGITPPAADHPFYTPTGRAERESPTPAAILKSLKLAVEAIREA